MAIKNKNIVPAALGVATSATSNLLDTGADPYNINSIGQFNSREALIGAMQG